MHIPKIMTQSRVQHQHVEEVVEVPVPMQQEEVVHVPKITTATRQVQQHVEQVVEVPVWLGAVRRVIRGKEGMCG